MADCWDDGPSSGTTSFAAPMSGANSFGSGARVGVGRGRGFGNIAAIGDALPKPGVVANGTSNSYGWDDTPQTNNNNNNNSWAAKNSGSGGGGDSWGGNKSSGGGWAKQFDDNEAPRGGGSRGGGSSRACFNCKEEGHTSRDCPQPRNDRKQGGCFKCGQDGHMSRECPSGGSGGGGGKGCFKCGEEGHMSRDCPNGGSSGGGGGKGCFKCGEDGHMSRECPSGGSGGGGKGCFKCGEEGHMSRECPNPGSGGGGGGGRGKCYKCDQDGHMARDCPNEDSSSKRGRECRKCGEEGHMARDCPNSESKGPSGCFNCGEEGHMKSDCPNPPKASIGPDGKPRPPIYIPPEPNEDEGTMFDGVPQGINFDRYDAIEVNISGNDPPKPLRSFGEANFRPLLNDNIQRSKYQKPTPVQKYAIPIISAKRDLMACAQTGSGKTAAFLLPMLQAMFESPDLPNNTNNESQEPWAIIIAPTRELAIQIYSEARKFSHGSIVKCSLIYGGTSVGVQTQRLQKGCHILVATPGRLLDFVEKGKVSFSQLHYLVLDEADRMLDMGFVPEVRKMVGNPSMPERGQRQTLMFSATFPQEIQHLAADFLHDYLFLTVGVVGAANQDVRQQFFQVSQFEKRDKLLDILKDSGSDRTLVFVEKKRTADFIASFLSQSSFLSTSIHGDRMQKEREEALTDFRTGRMPILVATAVAARGLDIKDVRHVVNYDLPQAIDEYVHRIGRTGRVGNLGTATSFFDSDCDGPIAGQLVKILADAGQDVPEWLEEAGRSGGGSYSNGPRGRFASRDIRKDAQSHSGWGNDNDHQSGGGGGFSSSHPDTDEAWD